VLSRLLSCVRRIATKVAHAVARATGWWRGKAWPGHLNRVAKDPAYAAAAAAILAGMLGLLPAREVIAAVLAASISALLREGAGGEGAGSRRVDPRDFA
jgi:hypothetical protein